MLSIIINNFNYGRFLAAAIESAITQTYTDIETIVVDDGSTDDSRSIVASYGSKIIPLFKKNGGQASAFNAGFAVSKGDIICFLDADDFFVAQKAARVVELFQKNPLVGWVFHRLRYVDASGISLPTALDRSTSDVAFVDLQGNLTKNGGTRRIALPATSGLCVKRSILQKILPMPEAIRITSDEFLKLAALYLSPGMIIPEKLALLRVHGSNAYTFQAGIEYIRSEVGIKTAFYLREKYPETMTFTNRHFFFSLARLVGTGHLKQGLSLPEARTYRERYLTLCTWIRYFPRMAFHTVKHKLKKQT